MATSELYPLLDFVLSSDPQDLCNSEKDVGRLSYHLRASDPKDVSIIREYIQSGISNRKYNRKNSDLVLMYLENAQKGSAANLRLYTRVKHHSSRRRLDTEGRDFKRRSGRADTERPCLDMERMELTPSDMSRSEIREFEICGEETERSEKRRLSDIFKNIDAGERRGRERVAVLRVAVDDFEKVRKINLSTSFTRILVHKWQRQAIETKTRHISDVRAEVCKRLVSQYRRAEAFQKASKVNLWKTAALFGKSTVKAAMLRLLLRNSNTSFQYRKKHALDMWKEHVIKSEKVTAMTENTFCSIEESKPDPKVLQGAVLRGTLKIHKGILRKKLALWWSKARDTAVANITEKISLRRILQFERALESSNKGEKQALVRWKFVTFPPPARLFPSLDEYKSALKTIISHLYRPFYDSIHIWHTKALVLQKCDTQARMTSLVRILQEIYSKKVRKVLKRASVSEIAPENRANHDPAVAFLYRFSKIGLKAAARNVAETYQIIQKSLRDMKLKRGIVAKKLISMSKFKTIKAFSYWKTIKTQQDRIGDAWRFMRASEILDKVGIKKTMAPLHAIVKLYPTIRRVCNRLNAANSSRLGFGFSQWKNFLLTNREENATWTDTAAKFQSLLLRLPRKQYQFAYHRISQLDTIRAKLSLRLLIHSCQVTARQALHCLRRNVTETQQKHLSGECKALMFQIRLIAAARRGKKETFLRITAGRGRIIAAIRAFATRLQASQRAAVEKWKQTLLKKDTERVESQVKGQKMTKTLEKIARKPLRSGLLRKPEKTTVEMGQKLRNTLSKVPAKILKLAFDMIIGKHLGNLKLKIVFLKLKNPIKACFRLWSKFVATRKLKDLSNAIRARKMREALTKVPISTENDGFMRLFKQKNRCFEALTLILKELDKPSREGFKKWRIALELIKKGKIEEQLKAEKTQKLLLQVCRIEILPPLSLITGKPVREAKHSKEEIMTNTLKSIAKKRIFFGYRRIVSTNLVLQKTMRGLVRILKEKPKSALKVWKEFVQNINVKKEKVIKKAEKLQFVMTKVAFRTLRDANNRILGTNSRLKSAIRAIMTGFSHGLQRYFRLWAKYTPVKKVIPQPLVAHKFSQIIEKLPLKCFKFSLDCLFSSQSKQKSALRRLLLNFHNDEKLLLKQWKLSLIKKESELVISQYRPSSISRMSIKKTMPTSPSNSSHCEYSAMFERDNIMAARLGEMVQILKNIPRSALYRWKLSSFSIKKAPVIDRTKAQKVTNALIKMLRRQVRSANFRSKSQPEIGRVTSDLHAEKMRTNLTRLTIPLLKYTFVTITADQVKVKRAIRVIIFGFSTGLKRVFKEWKRWVELVKNGGNWDLFRAQKLRDSLYLIPFPKLRIGFERVMTQGNRLRKALKTIIFSFNAAQRSNLSIWKRCSDLSSSIIIQQKEIIKDYSSAYKLLHDIDSLFAKVKRNAFSKIKDKSAEEKRAAEAKAAKGEHNQEDGVLERIINRLFGAVFKVENDALRRMLGFAKLQKVMTRLKAVHRMLSMSTKFSRSHRYAPAFALWKNFAAKRELKVRQLGVYSMMYNTSLSLQTCFWRWKVVKDCGEFIFPHQFSFLRHTARVLDRVQNRGVARSFLLLSVNKRQLVDGPRTAQTPPIRFLRFSTNTSRKSSLTDEDEFITSDVIPTIICNKLTAPEMVAVKQMGALETFGLRMQTIRSRNISAAFVSIKDEGELKELRECNDMLMDDLTKLQKGNERLMETFKESTHNLEILSKKLDILKTERVVRVLEKVSTQLPLLEALLLLKLNAGISISY